MMNVIDKLKWKVLIGVSCIVFGSGLGQAEIEDNADYQDAYQAWAATHFALLPTSFLPGPVGTAADLSSIGIDVRIKTLPASLLAPTPDPVMPNSSDGCHFDFYLPQNEAEYENLYGLVDIKELPADWGALSEPTPPWVEHANAAVKLKLSNEFLDEWSTKDKTVIFPSGDHPIRWSAHTQLDPLIDVTIPFALFVITNEVKYLRSFFSLQTDPATTARAAEIGGLFLINAGIEAGLISAGQIETNIPIDTAEHAQVRPFTVYDVNPPQISTSEPNPASLEANSFGGERWSVHKDQFRATITATDPCDQPVLVGNDAPFLLPLGTTQVTWEVLDTGPVGGGNTGRTTVVQNITVEDTRAPIILAPPSRVLESSVTASAEDFDIGTAVVFDVADPDPVLDNTVGSGFQPDTRTEVIWTATDSSGNAGSQSQWITVKTPGTNTAPSVSPVMANGLTAEHIDITLMGSDSDFLSGRFDPLKFDITVLPANGFFVAPLMPYFIEDFRVRPGDAVGDILNASPNPAQDLETVFCDANPAQPIPIDFVYQSEFVHVDDTGTSYVLDRYWQCGSGLPVTHPRLSRWDADGQYLDQIDIVDQVKRITLDADGFIYAVTPGSASDALFMQKYDTNLSAVDSWRLDGIPVSLGNPRLLGATMDSETGLIFATDKRRIYVFDGADGQFIPGFLGTLKNAENFLSGAPSVAGSSSRGFYIEIDSTGALYVVDSGLDRIHKFEPTAYDGITFAPGDHVGWLGRCDSGPGCDEPNGRSFGYSCSDDTPCDVLIADGNNCGSQIAGQCSHGSAQGQFHTPIGMALDGNDILYVTDYDNSRVQRFTALGDFAGEAASTCDGSCFVLGDMGRPLDISVNATKFHVLDLDRSLMHVFETAPFKEITDDSVVVTYASDNDFQGTDGFAFVANDGLVDSAPAMVTVDISRNFRPPEAFDGQLTTDEDTALNLTLVADDPDGIVGQDFNGLDVLTYEILQAPLHGQLNGSDANWVYTPDADYNGTDQLVFQVNDGVFDSNVATVDLVVNAVNDIPTVQFIDGNARSIPSALWPLLKGKIAGSGAQAGLGFPMPLMAEYTDPDAGQKHFVQIAWGDGTIDFGDQNPPADPQNPPSEPIITTAINSLGQTIGEHTYLVPGVHSIGVVVLDEQGGTSDPAVTDVEVIPMVDVTLQEEDLDPDNYPEPGQATSLSITVTNTLPADPVVGLPATQVQFAGQLPDGVQWLSTETTQGVCTHLDQISTCQLGTMVPGAEVVITVNMLPDLNFDPTKAGYVADVTSQEPDASVDNLKVIEIPIQFNEHIFTNGFESN